MKKLIATGFCSLIFATAAQSQEIKEKERDESNAPHHRFTIMMANAHIPGASETEGTKKNFVVPAWGFDYDYWFNSEWGIGLHNDLVLQQYKVEKSDDSTELIRNNPFSMSLVGLFKPGKHLVFIAGLGREFEKTESFNLMDIAVEYGFELPKDWELSVNFKYENKFNAYDSYLFGIGISKILHSKR